MPTYLQQPEAATKSAISEAERNELVLALNANSALLPGLEIIPTPRGVAQIA